MLVVLILAALVACDAFTNWDPIGPINIGDDVNERGESGTLADAVSPASNPNLIYTGGQNNGASSGVLKSVDGGKHWTTASNGMYATNVLSLFIVDTKGDHLLCNSGGIVFESLDGAASWTDTSLRWGRCPNFQNVTINGLPYILAACEAGIAAAPATAGSPLTGWTKLNLPPTAAGFRTSYITASKKGATTVLGSCCWLAGNHSGSLQIGTIINTTAVEWQVFPNTTCKMISMDPNDPDHFIYTPGVFQTRDGGKSFKKLPKGGFHTGIDGQGWLYTAWMGGAFRSTDGGATWGAYYDLRVRRGTNTSHKRIAHDYQRISLYVGGTVAFPSDQGLFIKPPGDGLQLISSNGNMNNNIVLSVAVSQGDGPGHNYIVTTVWDWSPLSSWDTGAHWTTPPLSCIGEGGGAYAMGKSNNVLVMHHHNVMYSPDGGKNFTRFVIPFGNSEAYGPAYFRKPGSRTEPSGPVFATARIGSMPWNVIFDKAVTCTGSDYQGDLGLHTNSSCLAAVALGSAYGWYPGVNYAAWRGDGNKHCYVCRLSGNASSWNYKNDVGAVSFAIDQHAGDKAQREMMQAYDANGDGRIDAMDLKATQNTRPDKEYQEAENEYDYVEQRHEVNDKHDGEDEDEIGGTVVQGGSYVFKSFNFGLNWTWTKLPAHVAGAGFSTDPTNNSLLYARTQYCIATSNDEGETWGPCWTASNLTGSFTQLVIKDSKTMLIVRAHGNAPLRTKDGGSTWHSIPWNATIAVRGHSMLYSWTGKTLVLHGNGGQPSASHHHPGYVWMSKDDGDTWTDETGDIVTGSLNGAQWFEGRFYQSSGGQGVLAKTLE